MKVLVVGSGGREHALAWKLAQSPAVEEVHAAPGNPGIATIGQCHPIRAEDGESLLELARTLGADLVVIGPEAPLVAGVSDQLRRGGVAVFGPSAAAAQVEGSKSFAKDVMRAAGVPFAERMSVARAPCVVKADGLTAGKGVYVCRTDEELDAALGAVRAHGEEFVIEELLEGEELSLFAIVDGSMVLPLPESRDYSRVGDGDTGANTGGMGSYSPVPELDTTQIAELVETIHRPVIEELAERGTPFIGCLYGGLMLTPEGPKVLEFNCRFGDPETQVILPRLEGDLAEALLAASRGDLTEVELGVSETSAVTVALAAGTYPAGRDTGSPITGVDDAEGLGAVVFHAGTAMRDGQLVTSGGRILNVTGLGDTLDEARTRAYEACERISFPDVRYRRDIAAKAVNLAG
ncbi:MAG TPA: phosphoribosylamine--glycine ligase [Gaiellaceae bacterium]